MVDWSNSRLHSDSLPQNTKSIPKEDEYPFGSDAWAESQAADVLEVFNGSSHSVNKGASDRNSITKQSGDTWRTSGESTTSDDTLPSSQTTENVKSRSQPESQSGKDMNEVERQLPSTRSSPVTQLYELSASDDIHEDTNTIYHLEIDGDKTSSRPSYATLHSQSSLLRSEDIHESLSGLLIEKVSEYLNEIPVFALEDVNRDLESLTSETNEEVVQKLWFSLPRGMQEQSHVIKSLKGDDNGSLVDVELMVNSWQFVFLVRCKVPNITFAMNLHLCLTKLSKPNFAIPTDLTDAAGRHWYDETMPKSLKRRELEVSQRLAPGNKRIRTQVEAHDIQLEDVSAENKVRFVQCQTDVEIPYTASKNDQEYRCMVYGCIKRFENETLRLNHFDLGKHSFVCPKTECAHFIFDSLGEFQNHIFMQHPEQEWKLFLPPQVTARLNSEFDNRQATREPIKWSGTASKERQRYRTQTWDY